MAKTTDWDKVFSITSWVLAAFLVYGAVVLWAIPPTGAGPIAGTVGIVAAQILYGCLYLVEASLLSYAKLKKKDKMRRRVLLVICLTGFFTTILGFALGGVPAMITPKLIGNFILSIVAASCWLHWTMKIGYVDYESLSSMDDEDV